MHSRIRATLPKINQQQKNHENFKNVWVQSVRKISCKKNEKFIISIHNQFDNQNYLYFFGNKNTTGKLNDEHNLINIDKKNFLWCVGQRGNFNPIEKTGTISQWNLLKQTIDGREFFSFKIQSI